MDQELVYPNVVEGEELILTSQNDANYRQLQAAELMVSLSSSLHIPGASGVAMVTQSGSTTTSDTGTTYNYPVIVASYSVGLSESQVVTETIADETGDHEIISNNTVNSSHQFVEYTEGSDDQSNTIIIGNFDGNDPKHLPMHSMQSDLPSCTTDESTSVMVMSSGVGEESFTVENMGHNVELGEIEYVQDGDIITVSEGHDRSTYNEIVSRLQYENTCNLALHDGNSATIGGNQVTTDSNLATADDNLATLGTCMATSTGTQSGVFDSTAPESDDMNDESAAYLDGETLHVSLKGGTGQSLTLINKRRLEQMTEGSEIIVVEPKKQSHQCYICKAEFRQITELYKHRVTHNEAASSMFKCNTCNLTFSEPLDLEKHRQLHLDRRVYKCCICHDTFSDLYNFRCHLRIHDKIATYTCDMCPFMVFGERKQYISHLEDHELAKDTYVPGQTLRLPCFVCKKDFPDRASLRKHQNYYHSEKCFKCALCGKAFVERAKLQRHQITHTGKKEFQCTYCEKSFGLKHNLLAHMIIHTKYKPWECSICRRKFGQKVSLNRHLKVHEGFTIEYL